MRVKSVITLIFLLILYILGIFTNLLMNEENPEYQNYINEYKNLISSEVAKSLLRSEKDMGLQYKQNGSGGTSSNFEGPQVHLKAIKFHNEILSQKDVGSRLKHFDGVSAHFDPDHSYFGLPDVKISIQDVRLYEMEKGPVGQFLGMGTSSEPKPFKTYRKRIVSDSLGLKNQIFEMQLWLTEFEVNIDIRPDRDIPITITDEEKANTKYPGFWYGSTQNQILLKDLDREHRDFRYGDLSFILEIIPDNSPIYVKTAGAQTAKADFAIGAIYCRSAKIGNEPDVQRISTNIHAGQPVFLNHEFDFETIYENPYGLSPNLETNAEKILDLKATSNDFIWNKPYYAKLFFNNLGTWRSGLFNQNQFHDQVSYSFLMPIFVVGSWDVIVPQEVLPEWNPPAPYIKKFTLTNLIPFWGKGFMGKVGGFLLTAGVLVLFMLIIFPGVKTLFRRVIKYLCTSKTNRY